MKHANVVKFIFAVTALLSAAGVLADTWKDPDTGYTWTYAVSGDTATICNGDSSAAISPSPTGVLAVPSRLGGKTVTGIGARAFYDCSGLTDVTIPGSVASVGDSAFKGCSGLVSVTISEGVKVICHDAFENCRNLNSVAIPASMIRIEECAFEGCDRIKAVCITDIAKWCEIDFGEEECSNPLYYAHALYLNGTLIEGSLAIPSGVTRIGSCAFFGCSGLTSVTMPNGVTNIGQCAFFGCSGLTSVTMPNGVTDIGQSAFADCSGLTSVAIPDGVTSIGDYAFSDCGGLISVSLPDSVADIGCSAFSGCSGLASVHISDLAKWCAISFCSSDANPLCFARNLYLNGSLVKGDLTIPDGATCIGDYAFYGCGGITGVKIPGSVAAIGSEAFYGCGSLANVTMPDGVTSIGNDAFYGTPFYDNLSDGLVIFGNIAYEMKGPCPASVEIPNGIVCVGDFAFRNCSELTSVTIGNSVTSIGNYAFSGCSGLTSVTIPNGVTHIGREAFSRCSGLTSVTIPNSVTNIGYHAFALCRGLTSVYVASGDVGRVRGLLWASGLDAYRLGFIEIGAARVAFDANGGSVGESGRDVVYGGAIGELPVPTRSGYVFGGWWTAKDGGVRVRDGDVVDFSAFANSETPTLYAQWRKPRKITVSGGLLEDGKTSKGDICPGDEVCVQVDGSKTNDKAGNLVNAFANWVYTPASADLGEGFDPFGSEVCVTMPDADVKLTANFVSGFAAYLCAGYSTVGDAGPGDFYWSVDNGKTMIPFGVSFDGGGYPVKAGKVTIKFYDKTGNWRAADITLAVDKRGTYKDGGVTRYREPTLLTPSAKFVPVNGSAKVKFDSNGGNVSKEVLFANGHEYGTLDIPSRKGYVFAGWWTAKDGGEHVTSGKLFDSAMFAGQKTPTLYAHWLQFKKLTMKDESAYAEWSLDEGDFDPELFAEIKASLSLAFPDSKSGGFLEGKGDLEVLSGSRVFVSVDDDIEDRNENEFIFQKWTVTPAKANLGPQFRVSDYYTELTMPSEDVTLQATYLKEGTYGYLAAAAYASPVSIGDGNSIAPPLDAFEWSPDGGKTWYKASQASDDDNYGYDDYYNENYDYVVLKTGSYTVTWRSTDPKWTTSDKSKISINGYDFKTVSATFAYVPQVVVDVMTYENGECRLSSTGGSATMNPKNGLVPHYKTITLAAKTAKNYAFQGWAFRKGWKYGNDFLSTSATWKLENEYNGSEYDEAVRDYIEKWSLEGNVDPDDRKVHVVAVFKAIGSYSADDVGFTGVATGQGGSYSVSGNAVSINAVVGCAVEDSLCGAPAAYPLSYKLDGKLPDGLKFDAKTGVLSGVPKKTGSSTVKIVASDPAKNSKSLTVNISVKTLPSWLVGDYRGFTDDGQDEVIPHSSYYNGNMLAAWCAWSGLNGLLELSARSDGKVSGKVVSSLGSGSVSGTLSWRDPACSYGDVSNEAEYSFNFYGNDAYCYISFYPDGTISGNAGAFNKQFYSIHGTLTGQRQDRELLADASFLDKYYTFAFSAGATASDSYHYDGLPYGVIDEKRMQSGYGYLTVKTDKSGGAKVTGQLPDGEKVSMSALVMPFSANGSVCARLYLFASPSAYKKEDWFVMALDIDSNGRVESEERSAWTIHATTAYREYYNGATDEYPTADVKVSGKGALYSKASALDGYYWSAFCAYSSKVAQQVAYKEDGRTYYDDEYAIDLGRYFFDVAVKGDEKGAISLVEKSPAPWVEDGEWNCWEDKKGNEITDPSQLSISFTMATGIFSGKASVYFDEPKPTSASLPYSGVMIHDGAGGYRGFGSAVYTYKYSYHDYYGRTKTDTKKVTLPVSLDPAGVPDGD